MARVNRRLIGVWAQRIASLSSGHMARERAKQTLRDAIDVALPAPHRNMIRRGYANHLRYGHYVVGRVGVAHYAGADPQKLADDAQLRSKLQRQYPRKLYLQDTMPLRRAVMGRLSDCRTPAAILATYPELAPLAGDDWPDADKTKVRRALIKAGWPIP